MLDELGRCGGAGDALLGRTCLSGYVGRREGG